MALIRPEVLIAFGTRSHIATVEVRGARHPVFLSWNVSDKHPREMALGMLDGPGAHVDLSPGAGNRLREQGRALERVRVAMNDESSCEVARDKAKGRYFYLRGRMMKLWRAQLVAAMAGSLLERLPLWWLAAEHSCPADGKTHPLTCSGCCALDMVARAPLLMVAWTQSSAWAQEAIS